MQTTPVGPIGQYCHPSSQLDSNFISYGVLEEIHAIIQDKEKMQTTPMGPIGQYCHPPSQLDVIHEWNNNE
ncbi:hypothetical protein RhiirA4_471281 [Rhizophagus irregularis]|uniref:Uncharacterized protein n=1 Tax=Rhizophagus irregularis TaxID=588596 RepID=A0A2I1H2V5_9GLOM|nr:hypothetical protein RhiirA4_471281 [Rhizophagus irregularis]